MSQAKVDKYKLEKANRKEIVAKEKRNRMIVKVCTSVVGIALVAWIAVSVVMYVIDNRPINTIYATTAGIDDYLNELYEEETESSTEDKDDKEESTESSTEKSTEK